MKFTLAILFALALSCAASTVHRTPLGVVVKSAAALTKPGPVAAQVPVKTNAGPVKMAVKASVMPASLVPAVNASSPLRAAKLAWLMSRPGVAAPIIGATKIEHLETAIKAVGLNLSDDECVSLETPYRPHGVRGYAFPEPVRAGVPKRG